MSFILFKIVERLGQQTYTLGGGGGGVIQVFFTFKFDCTCICL